MTAPTKLIESPDSLAGQSLGVAPCSAPGLWRVIVEYELLVVADTERKAESEAEYYAGKDGSEPSLTYATKVHKIEDVPSEWKDSTPFGGDREDHRTCRERVTLNDPDQRPGANEKDQKHD